MSDLAIFSAMPEVGASDLLDKNGAAPAHTGLAQAERVDVAAAEAARNSVLASIAPDPAIVREPRSGEDNYAHVIQLDQQGQMKEAADMLSRLVSMPGGEADACLGLAVFALRLKDFQSAQVLAARCLDLGARHPRACSILGMVALHSGNGSAARTYLAAAARIARIDPSFSTDLRGAQRVLLKMHVN
ncbi:hypothetical protein [Rhizobium oryzicola]|uniref:Tetratricopeptide repeat protein n=1 Tax=Rhizobium oryzicola TaxID=1232668 RepID=A0ABT8SZ61_9HYPH|nr:hypothetical protein [Rhizobium oryzicola]MDO1583178.1 hypothetical protein [Rhizobium oryzicola]